MPSRVIRGEINSSESLSRVSPEADLTFRALIVAVDDYGRFDARPGVLKATLFPLRDTFTPERIMRWVIELANEGCVDLYEVGGRPFLSLTGWEKHRGASKRGTSSKYPENKAPRGSAEIRGNPGDPGDPSESRESGVESRESGVESRGGCKGVDVSLGREAPRSEPAAAGAGEPARPTTKATRKAKSTAPDDLDPEQKRDLLRWVREKQPEAEPELRQLVDACLDHFRASGKPMADWTAVCRTWIRNRRRFEPRPAARERPQTFDEIRVSNTKQAAREAMALWEARQEELHVREQLEGGPRNEAHLAHPPVPRARH